jgi:FixJ family two-component response regulator
VSGHAVVSVVDDDLGFLNSLVDLIESAGHRVHKFNTAKGFLESGAAEFSDVLITDLQMHGMDGLALMDAVAGLRRLSVIVITAHAENDVRARAAAKGCTAFLSKPFDPNTLLGYLRSATP